MKYILISMISLYMLTPLGLHANCDGGVYDVDWIIFDPSTVSNISVSPSSMTNYWNNGQRAGYTISPGINYNGQWTQSSYGALNALVMAGATIFWTGASNCVQDDYGTVYLDIY